MTCVRPGTRAATSDRELTTSRPRRPGPVGGGGSVAGPPELTSRSRPARRSRRSRDPRNSRPDRRHARRSSRVDRRTTRPDRPRARRSSRVDRRTTRPGRRPVPGRSPVAVPGGSGARPGGARSAGRTRAGPSCAAGSRVRHRASRPVTRACPLVIRACPLETRACPLEIRARLLEIHAGTGRAAVTCRPPRAGSRPPTGSVAGSRPCVAYGAASGDRTYRRRPSPHSRRMCSARAGVPRRAAPVHRSRPRPRAPHRLPAGPGPVPDARYPHPVARRSRAGTTSPPASIRPATAAASTPRSGGVPASTRRSGGVRGSSRRSGVALVSSRRFGGVRVSSRRFGGVRVSSRPSGVALVSSRRSGGARGSSRPSGEPPGSSRRSGAVHSLRSTGWSGAVPSCASRYGRHAGSG
jgi:hypothetical protein